ncbi:E3 ubiquitin-protein ligase TRIM56-like [Argopecten irradians]|uniref:E3 ubiquitin-protein ligase TRIM56-like n=1 Tax=Argopecten irradians TaxID=31199 RepID=UPI0037157D8F
MKVSVNGNISEKGPAIFEKKNISKNISLVCRKFLRDIPIEFSCTNVQEISGNPGPIVIIEICPTHYCTPPVGPISIYVISLDLFKMAEGGRLPELDLHLLECPICLERLQQPKSLPCLHTFCQECLGTYITRELSEQRVSDTSFPCPICRKMTAPVNQAETKGKWAGQFPTNAVIQDLIQLKERTSEVPYCTPCQTKGSPTNPAKFWCKTLDLDLCEECKVQYHDILHRNCDIIDVSVCDVRHRKPEESTPKCEEHNGTIIWYCEDHRKLGCNECIIEYHRQCEVVMKAKKYLEKLKNETKLEDMKNLLKKGSEVMKSFVKDFDEQIQSLVHNQDLALKSITDLRQRIEEQLDELQKAVTDKVVTRFKEEKMTIEASLRQCERLMNGMLNTLKTSVKAADENNHIEAMVSYLRGQAEVDSCKDLIKEMQESFTSVSIHHQVLDPGTPGADMLGKVVTEKKTRSFPADLGFLSVPLIERQVKEIGKFNVKIRGDKFICWVRGIVCLPDTNIVVSDRSNNKIKLFTDEGQYLDQVNIPANSRDMCLVNDTSVAVTGNGIGVRIFKVEDKKLSLLRIINTTRDLYGITYNGGRFVVSDDKGGVYSLIQDGATDLLHDYKKTCWYLTHDSVTGDSIVSVDTNNTGDAVVSRLSADKRHTDVMKVGGVVIGARGIDVDREGNIYVCGWDSHNVVQMSGDGTRVRELLTTTDGVEEPTAIVVRGDKFVISIGNYIHIFQLQ